MKETIALLLTVLYTAASLSAAQATSFPGPDCVNLNRRTKAATWLSAPEIQSLKKTFQQGKASGFWKDFSPRVLLILTEKDLGIDVFLKVYIEDLECSDRCKGSAVLSQPLPSNTADTSVTVPFFYNNGFSIVRPRSAPQYSFWFDGKTKIEIESKRLVFWAGEPNLAWVLSYTSTAYVNASETISLEAIATQPTFESTTWPRRGGVTLERLKGDIPDSKVVEQCF